MYLYTNCTKIDPNWAKYETKFCQPCFTRSINLCCKQLKTCSIFQSAFNKNTFLIRNNVTCKSSCVIYLMERSLCNKSQYVGKPEYSLNLRINTIEMFGEQMVHRVTSMFKCQVIILMLTLSLLSLKRFIISDYQSWKFVVREKIEKTEHREDFFILKLQALSLQDLNISLNYPQDTTESIW